MDFMAPKMWGGIPYAFKILNMVSCPMLSKALKKSMKVMMAGEFLRLTPSMILLRARIFEVVDLPGLKPLWLPRNYGSITGRMRFSIILLMTFATKMVSAIPR